MDETADRLDGETERWKQRLDEALSEAEPVDERGAGFLDNVRAYRSDADHFVDEGDLVRGFEAVVWAWAWLEIGARIGSIDWDYPGGGFEDG